MRANLLLPRYQIVDVLAGSGYTLVMSLLILYGLKALRMVLRGTRSAGFDAIQKSGRWKLEAIPLHEWRKETKKATSVALDEEASAGTAAQLDVESTPATGTRQD